MLTRCDLGILLCADSKESDDVGGRTCLKPSNAFEMRSPS